MTFRNICADVCTNTPQPLTPLSLLLLLLPCLFIQAGPPHRPAPISVKWISWPALSALYAALMRQHYLHTTCPSAVCPPDQQTSATRRSICVKALGLTASCSQICSSRAGCVTLRWSIRRWKRNVLVALCKVHCSGFFFFCFVSFFLCFSVWFVILQLMDDRCISKNLNIMEKYIYSETFLQRHVASVMSPGSLFVYLLDPH